MRTSQRLHLKVACFAADGKPLGTAREEILGMRPGRWFAPNLLQPQNVRQHPARLESRAGLEKMGTQPDKEVVWPSLVFSMDSGNRGAVFVPLCSGVLSKGRIKISRGCAIRIPVWRERRRGRH